MALFCGQNIKCKYIVVMLYIYQCHVVYTSLKKHCRMKSINDGQCDTMELWEDGRDKFVTGFYFLIFKIFSFQDNLKSKFRHAVLL